MQGTVKTLATNLPISSVITTSAFNVSASIANASYSATLTSPSTGSGQLSYVIELSTDGGNTWSPVISDNLNGGFAKGTSNPAAFQIAGTVPGNFVGNKLRGRIVSITGTWTVSLSVTT